MPCHLIPFSVVEDLQRLRQIMTSYPLLRSLAVFTVWTVASFLCHHLAKMALEGAVSEVASVTVMPVAVTAIQILLSVAVLEREQATHGLSVVILVSHCLATLATNASLALTFASSTLAIKMLEPVSSAVLQRLMFGTTLKAESLVGMVAVVVGAVVYVGYPTANSAVTRAVALAVISNLALGVRNIAIKHGTDNNSWHVKFRSRSKLAVASTGTVLLLSCFGYLPVALPPPVFPHISMYFVPLSLASGLFHVTYTYVSTCLVLPSMSVPGHALANILKRVLVVCLLHVSRPPPASLLNWGGLALCAAGLLLYNRGTRRSHNQPSTHDSRLTHGSVEQTGR